MRARHPLAIYWTYTLLRIAIFVALWGLLALLGLGGLIGAAVALALSVPLSFVLLSRQRAALTQSMHDRIEQRQARSADLDARLSGAEDSDQSG